MKISSALRKAIFDLIQETLNAMPLILVLVRHGQSEGNVASKYSRKGDDTLFTSEFLARPSS